QDPVRKLLYKPWREQAHVSSKADEIDFIFFESRNDLPVMNLSIFALRGDDCSVKVTFSSDINSPCIGSIRNNQSYARVRNTACVNAVRNGNEVGTTPGKQDAEIFHSKLLFITETQRHGENPGLWKQAREP